MDRSTLSPLHRWTVATALGSLSYLVILASGKTIPTPLRVLLWGFPIGLFAYSVRIIPAMEEQINQEQGMRSLIRQQEEHSIIRQHQLDMTSREINFLQTLDALRTETGLAVDPPSANDGNWGFSLGNPFGLLESSVPLDRKVLESLGEPALALWHYLSQRNHNLCDKNGWIGIEKIRANWGKDRNINTEGVRQLLSGLNSFSIGCWQDSRQQSWRLLQSL